MRHFPRQSTVIRVELGLPNGTITVDREAASHHRANDVYVAIREAFDDARRQLEQYLRRPARPYHDS